MVHNSKLIELDNLLVEARQLLDSGNEKKAKDLFSQVVSEALTFREQVVPIPKNPLSEDSKFVISVLNTPKVKLYRIIKEVIECIFYGLKELGYDTIINTEFTPTNRKRIVLGTGLLSNAKLLGYSDPIKFREDTILYNLEQVNGPEHFVASSILPWLMAFHWWDYSSKNIDSLKLIDHHQHHHVPLGYVPQLTRIPERVQDIDVLFYGQIKDRRQHILNKLRSEGVNVVALNNTFEDERDAYIARAKIVLRAYLLGY